MLAVLASSNALGGVFRYPLPEFALRFSPWDAVANERRAEDVLTADASPAAIAKARAFALRAWRRDPTSVIALRTLALTEEGRGRPEQSRTLMAKAATLSRRDFGVEMWHIESAVARDDVTAALRHFDIALRTQRTAPTVLFPVLVGALSDARLIDPIAAVLAQRPQWSSAFLTAAAKDDAVAMPFVALAASMQTRGSALPLDVLAVATDAMVARGRDELAWQLYARQQPDAARQLLRDPQFRGVDRYIPFEWAPARAADRSASLGQGVLEYRAEPGVNGVLVSQVVSWPAGTYRLSADLVVDEGRAPLWQVTCLGAAPRLIASGAADRTLDVDVIDCPRQRLALVVSPAAGSAATMGAVRRVLLVRQ